MRSTSLAFRPRIVAAMLVAVLALAAVVATPLLAQASSLLVEITTIDLRDKRLTFKSSMGQLTLRVVPGVPLDEFKPGAKVLIMFGQDGTESVINGIEAVKP